MNTQRLIGIAILAALMLGLGLKWPFAAFGDTALFRDPPAETMAQDLPADPSVSRARLVRFNEPALNPDVHELRLNLFDDIVLTAERVRVDRSILDGYVWVGRVVGVPQSLVTLSVRGDILAGNVRLNGHDSFTISLSSQSQPGQPLHVVEQLDSTAAREPNGPDTVVPDLSLTGRLAYPQQAGVACEDGSVIDFLLAYTTAAREKLNGAEAMEAWINLSVSEMNSANAESQVGFSWRLVELVEVPYQESGNLRIDLERLRSPEDGYLDSLHTARSASKADLVSMIVSMGNQGACGVAYQMTSPSPEFAAFAFGVAALAYEEPYTCSPLTLIHELGHSMGNAHDIDNAAADVLFPYSHGYQDPTAKFRTIMAYDCPGGCPRITQWSNPDVVYDGAPTGLEYTDQLQYGADIARSMNEVSELVANFEPNCAAEVPTATPTATPVPENTATPTETVVPGATETPLPTLTPTKTPATATPKAPTPTATASPVPPTVVVPTATRSATVPGPYRVFYPIIAGQ